MKPLSDVLLALMYFAKRETGKLDVVTWRDARDALKNADYDQADHMTLSDVLDFLTKAYTEALARPDLHIHGSLADVLKAPFVGHHSVEHYYWKIRLENEYTLERI